ncbi:MAG: TonB-dependent receptor plug domain-containing protein, partial [Bacteroidota bacterium]
MPCSPTGKNLQKRRTINSTRDLQALYALIENTPYDGGTSWRALQGVPITGDEVLFFTDGMVNLGNFAFDPQVPWYFINSNTRSDHELLQQNASQSRGKYINLQRATLTKALQELTTENYTFLGMVNAEKTTEVYPTPGTPVTPNFSIAGNSFVEDEIALVFGYGTQPLDTISFVLPKENTNELVVRRWAQLKVAELNKNKKVHQQEIIALATQHHLVTDYTSLIILDRLRDYLRFNIEPPQELLAEYNAQKRLQKDRVAARRRGLEGKKQGLKSSYERILKWHQKDFSKSKDAITMIPNTSNKTESSPNTTSVTNTNRATSLTLSDKTVTGIVTDENDLPLPGVNVIIKETAIGTQTNFDGVYTLPAEPGAILEFSYLSYNKLTREVPNNGELSLSMEPDHKGLQEVVVVGYGRPKTAKAVGYAVTTLSAEEIENKPEEDVVRSLNGKVAGVRVIGNSAATGSGTNFVIRSQSSIKGNNKPLFIVDGVPFNGNAKDLGPDDIESVEVLKGLSSSVLYGQKGRNGVVIITTKKGLLENASTIASFENQIEQALNLQGWDASMPYLPLLEKQASVEMSYKMYLEIRNKYFNQPTFYIDVAQFFYDQGDRSLALRILTNILELKTNDQELLKALAYQLEVFKAYELATLVYQNLVESYPEHPQNYRDLALMYEASGKYQESFDLLHSLYLGDLLEKDVDNRFHGIEQLAFVELCRLVHKHGKKLSLTKKERASYPKLDMDIRVVLDWNHDNTDLDLWVKEPTTEEIFYSNKDSDIGGMLSKDMTRGFGPECYMLKKAMEGTYEISVDYYTDQHQKISG